jgi:hypothetical protein
MICNIRGTNGAGKSHLVRTILDEAKRNSHEWFEWCENGREHPVMTEVRFQSGGGLVVPGHYDVPCGGCDTLKTVDEAYDWVKLGAHSGRYNVLYEGILVTDDVSRAIEISRQMELVVIALTTPVNACVEAVRARRRARGNGRPFDPTYTINRAKAATNSNPSRPDETTGGETTPHEAA